MHSRKNTTAPALSDAERLFLNAVAAGLRGVSFDVTGADGETLEEMLRLAKHHSLLPLVLQAVYTAEAVQRLPSYMRYHEEVLEDVRGYCHRIGDELAVYAYLEKCGFAPCILKGVVCSSVYPNGFLRISSDADFLIGGGETASASERLALCGYRMVNGNPLAGDSAFQHAETHLCIELHEDEDFRNAEKRTYAVNGTEVLSLAPEPFLLQLLLHAKKHFCGCGIGIRQLCDVVLWVRRYHAEIDWARFSAACRAENAHGFASALFRIAGDYLGMPLAVPESFGMAETDPFPLLADILRGGFCTTAETVRYLSAELTRIGMQKDGAAALLFPGRDMLKTRYPFLNRFPFLLPLAWGMRFFAVLFVRRKKAGENRLSAILRARSVANERKRILRAYGMIGK